MAFISAHPAHAAVKEASHWWPLKLCSASSLPSFIEFIVLLSQFDYHFTTLTFSFDDSLFSILSRSHSVWRQLLGEPCISHFGLIGVDICACIHSILPGMVLFILYQCPVLLFSLGILHSGGRPALVRALQSILFSYSPSLHFPMDLHEQAKNTEGRTLENLLLCLLYLPFHSLTT